MTDGEQFVVIAGPESADGFVWWQLRDPNDPFHVGWMVADYLQLTGTPSTNPSSPTVLARSTVPSLPLSQNYTDAPRGIIVSYPDGWSVDAEGYLILSSDAAFNPLTNSPGTGQVGWIFMTPDDVKRDFSLAPWAPECRWWRIM